MYNLSMTNKTFLPFILAILSIPLLPTQAFAQNDITNPALSSLYSGGAGQGLSVLLTNLWRTAIISGGVAMILFLVWGGLQWMLAGSDKQKVENARNRIMQAIIGLAILASSMAIVFFVQAVLNLDILNFTVDTVSP